MGFCCNVRAYLLVNIKIIKLVIKIFQFFIKTCERSDACTHIYKCFSFVNLSKSIQHNHSTSFFTSLKQLVKHRKLGTEMHCGSKMDHIEYRPVPTKGGHLLTADILHEH